MTLSGSPEQVFPLLCPTREYDWIETWQCELIYSDSGFAEPGCIFTIVPGRRTGGHLGRLQVRKTGVDRVRAREPAQGDPLHDHTESG